MKLNQNKESRNIKTHSRQERMMVFSASTARKKVIKCIKIKEAHDIIAQDWQEWIKVERYQKLQ